MSTQTHTHTIVTWMCLCGDNPYTDIQSWKQCDTGPRWLSSPVAVEKEADAETERDRDLLTDEILQWNSLMRLLPLPAPPSFLSHLCPPLLRPLTPLSHTSSSVWALYYHQNEFVFSFSTSSPSSAACISLSDSHPFRLHCCVFSQGQSRRKVKHRSVTSSFLSPPHCSYPTVMLPPF